MQSLILLATIPAMLGMATSDAAPTGDQIVHASQNGEFLWKFYPPGALKRGEQGRVAFKLMIEPTGVISSCDVTESSGFKDLDTETCEIMGMYAQVKPVRDGDGRAVRAQQNGFIVWKLPPGATQVASASARGTMPKPDKMICRKDVTTGSLIATTKMCMTKAEWDRNSEDQKRHWEDQQGRGYTAGDAVIMCDGPGQC